MYENVIINACEMRYYHNLSLLDITYIAYNWSYTYIPVLKCTSRRNIYIPWLYEIWIIVNTERKLALVYQNLISFISLLLPPQLFSEEISLFYASLYGNNKSSINLFISHTVIPGLYHVYTHIIAIR